MSESTARLSNPVAALRHDLRTPVNHIVGYAEMLIEDLEGPAHVEQRAALERTITAAREALEVISLVLAPSKSEIERQDVEKLYASLAEPQRRITEAVRALLDATGEAPSATFVEDLQRILNAAARLVPENHAATPTAAGSASVPSDGAARILVVDDEEGNRDLLRRRLEREGYAVLVAAGGEEALDLVQRAPVDLVLLDMMMPNVDGFTVLVRLKSDDATRDLPVIMISALDDLQAIADCIQVGAEDYLPKPFQPTILKARIAGSLMKKQWRDQERETLRALGFVTAAASAVESGAYQPGHLAEIGQRNDELGRLARVMDRMATQVQERETRLRNRLNELRDAVGVARRSMESVAVADGHNLHTGEQFGGRYQITAVLGRGGMGTVYRARDVELGGDVAIKALKPELVSDDVSRERFKDEIRLARRITHRNVVRTHDFGEWDGVWYLTMEYVEGITLRSLLDTQGRLGVPATLALGTQLASSLAVAHEVGVVHRDIKPQNLLLDPEGVLKVMDFGVARLTQRTGDLTEAGLIVGTPSYMSPEQLTGEPVDARSDLYSVGAVLYECITGQLPIDAPTMISLFAKVLSEEVTPPSKLVADVPPAIDELIARLLAKRAEDRVQSAAELVERLQALG